MVRSKKFVKEAEARKEQYANRAESLATGVQQYLQHEEAGGVELERGTRFYDVTQDRLADFLDTQTQRKLINLSLPDYGPYFCSYSSNGSSLLLAGWKGHLSCVNVRRQAEVGQAVIDDRVRDALFLHDDNFYAVAQRHSVFLYNARGAEVHRFGSHINPCRLAFLPKHFLLVSVGRAGKLVYQDTSTGKVAGVVQTRQQGDYWAMARNPASGIIGIGDRTGCVTLWAPAYSEFLVKMKGHQTPINDLAFDRTGNLLATAGSDGVVKVWDMRTFQPLHIIPFASEFVEFSQRNVLAAASRTCVRLYDNIEGGRPRAMMQHRLHDRELHSLAFQPWEDVLGLGLSDGFQSIVVPGAGEPNIDSTLANPYETQLQRGERPVRQLLDKLPPATIRLDYDTIGGVRPEVDPLAKRQRQRGRRDQKIQLARPKGLKRSKKPREQSAVEDKKRIRRVMKMAKKSSRNKAQAKFAIHTHVQKKKLTRRVLRKRLGRSITVLPGGEGGQA